LSHTDFLSVARDRQRLRHHSRLRLWPGRPGPDGRRPSDSVASRQRRRPGCVLSL